MCIRDRRIPIGSLTNNIFLQDRGPSFSIKYKTLSLTSSNIDKKIKNYGINHLADVYKRQL